MNTIKFESSTFGKLNKIKNGNVFSDSFVFIKEFLQNCQRSKSKNVLINFGEKDGVGYFSCYDDGCGCKNPKNIFTLDYSQWESTNEGFGIGFLSCLAIPNLKEIEIKSKDWIATVDVEDLFINENLDVSVIKNMNSITGFYVELTSEWFKENKYEIMDYIQNVGKFLSLNIIVNGNKIDQIDLITNFKNSTSDVYYMEFHNSLFDGIISVSDCSYGQLKLYYEDRYVTELYFPYLGGLIIPKYNKITLREPDRESYQRDYKWYKIKEKIEECAKTLYKEYIRLYGVKENCCIEGIGNYLETKDFQKYLKLSFLEDDFNEDILMFDDEVQEEYCTNEEENSYIDESFNENTSNIILKPVIKENFKEENQVICNYSTCNSFYEADNTLVLNDFQKKKNLLKKSIWVRAKETEEYKNMIAKARYCGIPVIVTDNVLQERVLQEKNIAHISILDDVLKEIIIKNNVELKNANEIAFIEFLEPICKYFHLEYDTFRIANLETIREFSHNDEIVMRTKEKNTKNNIVTYGLCDGRHIYLDRNALKLSKFKIKNCSKATKYALLLKVSRTIAHELAHYLYNTTDNTVLHYKKEQLIWDKIISLY